MSNKDFSDREGLIWMNGEMIAWSEAKIHVLSSSLHYGTAIFEGIRAYETDEGTAIFRLEDHTKRFLASAKILEMEIPYDFETLVEAQADVVRQNNLKEAYIRPLAFYGPENMGLNASGLKAHVAIAAWSWGRYLAEADQCIRVGTSSYSRIPVNAAMSRAKASGHYINSVLASKEAIAHGYDEALLLDVHGFVMEGPGANLFIVRNGKIFTSELSSCLEGITRDTLMRLAEMEGLSVHEKRITRDEVYLSDEAFFTGTAAEVIAIGEVDRRIIGSGKIGPVTQLLQRRYSEVIKAKIRSPEPNWLFYL